MYMHKQNTGLIFEEKATLGSLQRSNMYSKPPSYVFPLSALPFTTFLSCWRLPFQELLIKMCLFYLVQGLLGISSKAIVSFKNSKWSCGLTKPSSFACLLGSICPFTYARLGTLCKLFWVKRWKDMGRTWPWNTVWAPADTVPKENFLPSPESMADKGGICQRRVWTQFHIPELTLTHRWLAGSAMAFFLLGDRELLSFVCSAPGVPMGAEGKLVAQGRQIFPTHTPAEWLSRLFSLQGFIVWIR
jgi:hypothetical protein